MSSIAAATALNQEPASRGKGRKSAKDARIDNALSAALYSHEHAEHGWQQLVARGATDAEIWHALLREFGAGGGESGAEYGSFAFLGGKGVEQPKFWFGQSSYHTTEKPTLAGARLVQRVRELLQIPQLAADAAVIGDAPAMNADQKQVFLADLEEEQRNRFEMLQGYDRLLAQPQDKKNARRLKSERKAIALDYEVVWDESVTALGDSDILQEVRDRIESNTAPSAAESINNGDAGSQKACVDCGLPYPDSAGLSCPICKFGDDLADNPVSSEEENQAIVATPAKATQPRDLECELSDSDLLTKLDELTTKLTEKDAVEQELKEVSAGYKGRIKTLDREIHSLTRTITSKRELREVECRERFNFDAKKVEVIRVDTFEVVETRTMTVRELQQTLPSI
jgi:hypothetical protein